MSENMNNESSSISPQMIDLQKSLGRGKSVIGIDIGASSVNVAQSVLYHGKPTIIKVAIEEIGLVSDYEREKATVEAIKRAMAHFNTQNADVVCSVFDQRIVVDYMTMPLMPESELAEAIRIEVSSSEYFSIEDPIIDYQIIGHAMDKGVEKINVMVAAISKSSINRLFSYLHPLEKDQFRNFKKILSVYDFMGLNLVKLIPISISLENVLKKSKQKMGETVATLEIGSMAAELNIYSDGHLVFSRRINVTGLDFTRSLTSALYTNEGKTELTLQEAEWVKKEFGIPSPSEEFLIKDKITANQVISLLRPRLEQLIREVARSFDFYYDRNRDGKIDKLILFGGGSMLKRLPEFLNSELGLPVGLGDPLQDISLLFEGLLNKEDAQKLSVAIGASLADPGGINLLPKKYRDSKKNFIQKLFLTIIAVSFVVISVIFYIFMLTELEMFKQQEAKSSQHYQALVPTVNTIRDQLLFQKLVNHRFDMGALLKELSYLPEEVYLTDVKSDNGSLFLSGFVTENLRQSKKILNPWVVDLKKNPISEVRITSLKEDAKRNTTKFVIAARIETTEGGP